MRTLVVGAGPGGLYLGLLLKKANPSHDVTVVERNPADATYGFGVVFSDETLGYLQEHDEPTFRQLTAQFARWDAIEVRARGHVVQSRGHGFSGIGRARLLQILQDRCRQLGVSVRFGVELDPADATATRGYDLIVAADGVNSRFREHRRETFGPAVDERTSRYAWFGTTLPVEHFTFSFRETELGLFWCHAYRYDGGHSTFIVECAPSTWKTAGLDRMTEDQSRAFCEHVFAEDLRGYPLLTNRSAWLTFGMLTNERWQDGRTALLGDAAHSAHFSIGSGTKLAMEDAISLAYHLGEQASVSEALAAYEEERKPIVERFQRAAYDSLSWFEGAERYMRLEPELLAFSLLSRSRRISYDNLKLRDPELVERVHRLWLAGQPALGRLDTSCPPMFTPYQLRGLRLENRIVVSPMCMYSARDGTPNAWHLVHLGSRAVGGAGLVCTEMNDVSPEARITPGCAGMYLPEHETRWKEIVDFVHAWTAAKICMQLGHAGRKGSTKLMWEGIDLPLDDGNWPLLAASAIPYFDGISQAPKAMDRADMDAVRDDFVRAARMADRAGFDMLELHLAHGYLLASFLSPLTNRRTDEYGGSIENRIRYPLEVFRAIREVWPEDKPMSARISATDWAPGGITTDDTVALARMLRAEGCDILDVSAGQTVPHQQPRYGRCFQTPFSDRIRNEARMPTMTVGNISTPDEINSILLAGRADLCVMARPFLRDPYWTLHAAAQQEYWDVAWPDQYQAVQHRPRERRVTPPLVVRLDDDPRGELIDLEDRLTELARRHYRSLNGEIVAALTDWLKRHGDEEPVSSGPAAHAGQRMAGRVPPFGEQGDGAATGDPGERGPGANGRAKLSGVVGEGEGSGVVSGA